DPMKRKQLHKGLMQLSEEGAVQVFRTVLTGDYLLGAVGVLQFDVAVARLKAEYNVDADYVGTDFKLARWIKCDNAAKLKEFERQFAASLALDSDDSLAYLAPDAWKLRYTEEQWPDVTFFKTRESL
ncbi:MAG: peptide chain release factor 3, partial [Mariprofundaceae bacterium]|nr:peptide chain release factor 3 [Mariprofundaceae bacterium]